MKTTIATILRRKGSDVLTIDENATVYQAIEKMEHRRVGSVVALRENEVTGIFTERDYLRRVILRGRTSKTTPVKEVMSTNVVYVEPEFTVEECLAVMTEKKFRHLPVMTEGELAGIVSIGDLVKQISAEAQSRVRYLEDYIGGQYPA